MELFQNFAYFTGNIAYEVWEKKVATFMSSENWESWSKCTIFFQLDQFLRKVSRMVEFTQDYEDNNGSACTETYVTLYNAYTFLVSV